MGLGMTGSGLDEPARSGGVGVMAMGRGPQENAGAAAGFGGELDAADMQMREPPIRERNDAGGDARAAERFGGGPEQGIVIRRSQEQESIQRQSESGGGGGKEPAVAVAPGDPSEAAGGDGQQDRQEKRGGRLGEEFKHRSADEPAAGQKAIEFRQAGVEDSPGAKGRGLILGRPRAADLKRSAAGCDDMHKAPS